MFGNIRRNHFAYRLALVNENMRSYNPSRLEQLKKDASKHGSMRELQDLVRITLMGDGFVEMDRSLEELF